MPVQVQLLAEIGVARDRGGVGVRGDAAISSWTARRAASGVISSFRRFPAGGPISARNRAPAWPSATPVVGGERQADHLAHRQRVALGPGPAERAVRRRSSPPAAGWITPQTVSTPRSPQAGQRGGGVGQLRPAQPARAHPRHQVLEPRHQPVEVEPVGVVDCRGDQSAPSDRHGGSQMHPLRRAKRAVDVVAVERRVAGQGQRPSALMNSTAGSSRSDGGRSSFSASSRVSRLLSATLCSR